MGEHRAAVDHQDWLLPWMPPAGGMCFCKKDHVASGELFLRFDGLYDLELSKRGVELITGDFSCERFEKVRMPAALEMGEQLLEDIPSIEVVVFQQRFELRASFGTTTARSSTAGDVDSLLSASARTWRGRKRHGPMPFQTRRSRPEMVQDPCSGSLLPARRPQSAVLWLRCFRQDLSPCVQFARRGPGPRRRAPRGSPPRRAPGSVGILARAGDTKLVSRDTLESLINVNSI
jgi:hypothetical protein